MERSNGHLIPSGPPNNLTPTPKPAVFGFLGFAYPDHHRLPTALFPMPSSTYSYPDPTTQTEKNIFRTKGSSKFYDPCGPASQASMKCLDKNNYDKSQCQEAFDAYKECKRIWVGISNNPH